MTNVITTRSGGSSESPFDSLNLGLHVGDNADAVRENRSQVARALGVAPEDFVLPEQVHGASVGVIADRSGTKTAVSRADALVTNQVDVPLMVLIADCVALSLYDQRKHVIGLAHAGWKGTLARIAEHTVQTMRQNFGTDPGDVLAGVSPSIGRGHYEVGDDVVELYRKEFGKASKDFVEEDMHGTCYLDLWACNEAQLRSAGIASDNIQVSEMCTACHPKLFYSHRHEAGRTGRFGAVMMLHGSGKRSY